MFLNQLLTLLIACWVSIWVLSTLPPIVRGSLLAVKPLRKYVNDTMHSGNVFKNEERRVPNAISGNSLAKKPDSANTPIMSSPNGLFRKPRKTIKLLP
jgi:hypothetical protein